MLTGFNGYSYLMAMEPLTMKARNGENIGEASQRNRPRQGLDSIETS